MLISNRLTTSSGRVRDKQPQTTPYRTVSFTEACRRRRHRSDNTSIANRQRSVPATNTTVPPRLCCHQTNARNQGEVWLLAISVGIEGAGCALAHCNAVFAFTRQIRSCQKTAIRIAPQTTSIFREIGRSDDLNCLRTQTTSHKTAAMKNNSRTANASQPAEYTAHQFGRDYSKADSRSDKTNRITNNCEPRRCTRNGNGSKARPNEGNHHCQQA